MDMLVSTMGADQFDIRYKQVPVSPSPPIYIYTHTLHPPPITLSVVSVG